MSFANQFVTDQDIRTTASTQGGEKLGQQATTADGLRYRYGKNGTGSGTALAPGKLCQGAVAVANHTNQTGATLAAGALSATYAVGNTAVTANQYAQGYLVVNAGTGAGQTLLIAGNTKAAGNGSPTLSLRGAVITATLASDSKFSLVPHLYSAAIIFANGTLAAGIAGVPNVSIPDTYYGWFQVGGTASVLSDSGAAGAGSPIVASDETDGAIGPWESDAITPILGYTMILGVSAEYRQVFLNIN